ncbi:hypothetical protein KC324_g17255 [Hortaea werneckii]|nr:hypothetical protein KC324_g17255 [Hortaea werneckii]
MPPSPQLEHSQSAKSEWGDTFEEDVHRTYSNLNSAATDASAGNSPNLLQAEDPQSRFSWSTVATQAQPPHQPCQQTPQQAIHPAFRTPKDKPASVPAQSTGYPSSNHTQGTCQTERGPPVQSILSRHRPIQRLDREDSPRRNTPRLKVEGTTSTRSASTPPNPNPTHTKTRAPTHQQQDPLNPNTPNKALPLPPNLASPSPHSTHLQHLLAKEQDLLHQRRNVHKTIHDLEQVERASPMEVSFSKVREAKRKLAELRARLEEVGLEEREVGIAISRARRREEAEGGEGGGLWVRRVTG